MRYFLFVLVLFSSYSFAEDFYWYVGSNTNVKYPSALAACSSMNTTNTDGTTFTAVSVNFNTSGNVATCISDACPKSGPRCNNGPYTGNVSRGGDSCPLDTVYDPLTGECKGPEPDPCEDKAGQTLSHEHRRASLDGSGASEPPSLICDSSCQASFDFTVENCYRYVKEGDLNGAFCKYRYRFNGLSCTPDPSKPDIFQQPPSAPPSTTTPSAENSHKCDTWTTNPDGSVTRSCTTVSEKKDPGTMNCSAGQFGVVTCTPGKPSPQYDKTEKDSTQTEKNAPDGTTTSTTTSTTTQTQCRGALPCTTESKTETSTTGTNPNGGPSDSSSSCTGTLCKSPDSDDSEDEPDPSENGACDPVLNPEGCEETPSSVSGSDICDAPPTCDGDAIQCAILRQTHTSRCSDEEARDYSLVQSDIEAAVQGDEYQLQEETFDLSGMFSTGSRFLPAACPASRNFSSSLAGRSYEISYEPICDFASAMSYLVIALASLFFVVYVGRSFGGE